MRRQTYRQITNNIAPGKCSNLDLEDDWQETTYKLSGDYDFSDSVLMYATFSKGFKSGGFNTGSCNDRFDPETVTAYEVGLKSTFADGRLRLNLAAYLYDYEDFQARLFINNASLIENASDVENLGFEAEFVWVPVDALQIDGGLSIMESEFKSFVSDDPLDPPGLVDLEGNQTLRSPDVSYNVGVQYMHWFDQGGGDITVRYEASYKDDYFTTVFNNDFAEIKSHAIQNFRVIWNANNQWQVQGFVENFTDEEVLESLLASATIGGTIVSWTPPRLWGVQIRYTM